MTERYRPLMMDTFLMQELASRLWASIDDCWALDEHPDICAKCQETAAWLEASGFSRPEDQCYPKLDA
jgi:hypothetical protein